MRLPTISVIMPNYNHARFAGEAIEAILSQSAPPIELLVIDDVSTDDSVDVIRRAIRGHPGAKLIRNRRNQGAVRIANRLYGTVTGDYLYFAAADDRIKPDFFKKSLSLLARYPQAGLCAALTDLIDEKGSFAGVSENPVVSGKPRYLSPRQMRRSLHEHGYWIEGITVIHRREALMDTGGFDAQLGSYCDGFFDMVQALRHGVCFIPEPLTNWRRMESGYAVSQAADYTATRKLVSYAAGLMRTQYADLFPKSFVTQWERLNMNAAFHRLHARHTAALAEMLSGLKNQGVKKVAMYGIGSLAELTLAAADRINLDVVALFDGSPEKHGKKLMGRKILAPGQLSKFPCDAVLITAAMPRYIQEIRRAVKSTCADGSIRIIAVAEEFGVT